MSTLSGLRARALAHTMVEVSSIRDAVVRLGFVQADPIRAPARAQDLILRQRVSGYRDGDLESNYETLQISEDYLYAYGFLPREVAQLLHPRAKLKKLSSLDHKVLAAIRELGTVHPRDLDARFAQKRVVNAWGGYSRATKRALERLHHCGLVEVAGRKSGVRLYRAASDERREVEPATRMRGLIEVIANVLAPVSSRTLHSLSARLQRWIPRAGSHRTAIAALLRQGVLEADECEGVIYRDRSFAPALEAEVERLRGFFLGRNGRMTPLGDSVR